MTAPLPLHHLASAIESNDVATVESMLANASIDVNWRMPRDDNPPALVLAVCCGRFEIAELLLNAGARVDDADDQGATACHGAVLRNRADLLAILLAHGPDLSREDWTNRTPLAMSLDMRYRQGPDAVETDQVSLLLIEAGSPLTGLWEGQLGAFAAVSPRSARALIARGVELSAMTDGLPLVAAGQFARDTETVEMLVNECGLDLDARTSRGQSCVYAATRNPLLLRWFVAAGADVNGPDDSNYIPLHAAVVSESYDTVCCLLAAGAKATACDEMGFTPLHRASGNSPDKPSYSLIVHALIASGGDLDAKDHEGDTARSYLSEDQEFVVDADAVEAARRDIARVRLDFVRGRAFEVCVGLQSRGLDALVLCEILQHACGPLVRLIAYHQWWAIATTVKHFATNKSKSQ